MLYVKLIAQINNTTYNSLMEKYKRLENEFEEEKTNKIREAQRKAKRSTSNKLKRYIKEINKTEYSHDEAMAKLVNELLTTYLPFKGINLINEITTTINRLRILDGYKYGLVLNESKLLSKVGLITFCSSILNLSTTNTELALGIATMIFTRLFGYSRVPAVLEKFKSW